MSQAIITVENLGKRYSIRHQRDQRYTALRDVISEKAKSLLRESRKRKTANGNGSQLSTFSSQLSDASSTREDFWALRHVNFEVRQGEVVGIIGRNGAGKSTLLKILSRITEPTEGKITLRGRVASLLEVGTGFHPELTGRENIYLNGAILGMSRAEIKKKFDEIVAFAETERFLDTPVKRYSSGMYVRLAFAVAAHLEPEILVVDEVLAVGDAEFQKKCLGKMSEVSKEGRTVLFVSHNMGVLSTLTNRAILLSQGRKAKDGVTATVIADYLHRSSNSELIYTNNVQASAPIVTRAELQTSAPNNVQFHADPMIAKLHVSIPRAIDGARLELYACDELGKRTLYLWRYDSRNAPLFRTPGKYEILCRIPKLHLYVGRYTLRIHLAERYGGRLFQKVDGVCPFEVMMSGVNRDGGWQFGEGTYIEEAEWHILSQHSLGERNA